VSVDVDETGRDQLAGGIDHFPGGRRADVGPDRGDFAGADRYVGYAVDALGRIDNATAFDDQIELGGK
jgi:hypothetical protein